MGTRKREKSDPVLGKIQASDGLGVGVVVAIGRGGADDGGALGGEEVVELAHRIAEVVTVASLVAKTENRHLLAAQVEVWEGVVEERVPLGA